MKLIKKLLAVMFVLALLVSCGTTPPKPAETPSETPAETPTDTPTEPVETGTGGKAPTKNPSDTLVIGAPELSGSYIDGFGNSTYDVWIKNLIHGYGTYVTDEGGKFQLNPTVVKGEPEVSTDEEGNKTFKYVLQENLVWNDGTPITAKDFVFSYLFTDSKEMAATGSSSIPGDGLVGHAEYRKGEADSFPGVKLLGEYEFQLTIAAKNLPYFYETAYASAAPTPMHVYSPNLAIGEDGSSLVVKEGYTLSDADVKAFQDNLDSRIKRDQAAVDGLKAKLEDALKSDDPEVKIEEGSDAHKAAQKKIDDGQKAVDALVAQREGAALPGADGAARFLLQTNAYWVADTFRFNPTVTSGAYNFVSLENKTVTVTLNDKYVGDFRGKKPTIKNVMIKTINQKTDMDQILTGDIDLVLGVIQGEKIEKIKQNPDKAGYTSYSRNGYGMISFVNNGGPTKHKEVRQAVAYLLDRQQFVQNVLGGYGSIVDGEYGLSQWMYQARKDQFEEKAISYTEDFDKANAALDASPYKFEKDGTTPWDAAKAITAYESNKEGFDYWRYDADGKQLRINHFGTTENEVTDTINAQLPDKGKKVGLQYTVTMGDFDTLLALYYNDEGTEPESREFLAYNLATGFTAVYDPFYSYHSSFIGTDYNTAAVDDPKVDELVENMRKLSSDKVEEYADAWLEWALWYNENLPRLPLYSNEYYDMYHIRVKGLETTPVWDWSNDIADLSLDY